MVVFALPGFTPNSKLKLFEAALQRFPFPAFSARSQILPCELAQIFSDQAPNVVSRSTAISRIRFTKSFGRESVIFNICMRRESPIPCKSNPWLLLCGLRELCAKSHILHIALQNAAC